MKDLHWQEPAAYRRAIYYENERRDPLKSLKFAGAAFAIILGLRFLAGLGPEAHPPPWWPNSVLLAAAVALFAAYGLPALMSLLPGSMVIVSDKGVNNNVHTGRGWSIRFWPWEQIAYGSTWTDTAGARQYEVISLHGLDGTVLVTLATSPRVSLSDIHVFFQAHGKQVVAKESARNFS